MFTIKILLYAGNSSISSPLVFIALGKIYFKKQFTLPSPRQSAGNFSRIEKESLDNCELAGEINLFFSYLGETNPIVRRLIDIPAQNPLLTYPTVEGSAR